MAPAPAPTRRAAILTTIARLCVALALMQVVTPVHADLLSSGLLARFTSLFTSAATDDFEDAASPTQLRPGAPSYPPWVITPDTDLDSLPSMTHMLQSLYTYTSPTIPANSQFLDFDNSTFVFDGTIGTTTLTYQWTFDATSQFMVFYLNQSTTTVSMKIALPLQAYSADDIDLSYLPDEWVAQNPYQSFALRPSLYAGSCSVATACKVTLTLQLIDSANSGLPIHLGAMKNEILPWSTSVIGGAYTGNISTYGLEIGSSDLPVLFQMLPEQASPQVTDAMMYLFNAENPIQWFYPGASYKQHSFGGEIDILMSTGYANGKRSSMSSSVLPNTGGNPLADPNSGAASFTTALYLLAIYATPISQPTTGSTNRFELYCIPDFHTTDTSSWNGSTYGIVGALTLLVLCLLSCAVAFLRRRCHARGMEDNFFGGATVLTRAQRDELPQVDANGRPIRYDAYGRVLPDLGAGKDEIEALPVKNFQEDLLPSEDAHCTVCLGDYETDEKIKFLPCGHVRTSTQRRPL